jgi:hypothetical protein
LILLDNYYSNLLEVIVILAQNNHRYHNHSQSFDFFAAWSPKNLEEHTLDKNNAASFLAKVVYDRYIPDARPNTALHET